LITIGDGGVQVDGRSVADLAESLPTPFFLFSERTISENLKRLSDAFTAYPGAFNIDYCVKTNYLPALVRLFCKAGVGAMVSCGWELRLALRCGFDPERITFHGACKTPEELASAVDAGIGLIHVYSEEELDILQEIAAEKGRHVDVSVRLSTPGPWWSRGLAGWYAKRLGIPWEQASPIFSKSKTLPCIRSMGLSLHLGTQIRTACTYTRAISALCALIRNLESEGHTVERISLGGGWPSPTLLKTELKTLLKGLTGKTAPRPETTLNEIPRKAAYSIAAELGDSPESPGLRLEPGRGLIGSAGALITRVVSIRGRWVFVDASRNFLPESSLVGQRRILSAAAATGGRSCLRHISGRTVNTMDVMALGVRLPRLRAGDILVFMDAGAYSLSRATRYAGTIPAAYFLSESGELTEIRKEDQYEDIVGAIEK